MAKVKWEMKIPTESKEYPGWSELVINRIDEIIGDSIKEGRNRIFINTNLKRGLPLENINKVAGPFVEAWAVEQFEYILDSKGNKFHLIHVEQGKRLDAFDIILQFKRTKDNEEFISANIDVKATAEDIPTSGKSPNITSYARIRTEYINDPDYIFLILSLKHRVFSEKDEETGMTMGIMEIVNHAVYDLKYVGALDLNYNPALGTGQLQIRDIHYVTIEKRNTWEFVQLLDKKYKKSHSEESWFELAKKYEWIKVDE